MHRCCRYLDAGLEGPVGRPPRWPPTNAASGKQRTTPRLPRVGFIHLGAASPRQDRPTVPAATAARRHAVANDRHAHSNSIFDARPAMPGAPPLGRHGHELRAETRVFPSSHSSFPFAAYFGGTHGALLLFPLILCAAAASAGATDAATDAATAAATAVIYSSCVHSCTIFSTDVQLDFF